MLQSPTSQSRIALATVSFPIQDAGLTHKQGSQGHDATVELETIPVDSLTNTSLESFSAFILGEKDVSRISYRAFAVIGLAAVACFVMFNMSAGFDQFFFFALVIVGLLTARCISKRSGEISTGQSAILSTVTSPSAQVLAVTGIVGLDVMFYSFCLPFLPELFDSWGRSNSEKALLASTYSYSALATGVALLVLQGFQTKEFSDRDCWRALAVAAGFMTAISLLQAAFPSYWIFFITRCLQGSVSQFCWSYSLALGMRLSPLLGVGCIAWISSGESIGELAGPWFGSVLYELGGVRCPFMVACCCMFLNTCLLSALAITEHVKSSSVYAVTSDSKGDAKQGQESAAMGFSVLGLPRVMRLCTLLILACAMARGALDVLAPIHLDEAFSIAPGGIGQIFGFGTVCYLCGSMLGGRGFPSTVPLRTRAWVMCAAHTLMSIAMIFFFRAASHYTLALYVAMYLSCSALVNVSTNIQLEEIGAQHGGSESLATLSVLGWSVGFALGGVVTQVAAKDSEARVLAMTCIGLANFAWLIGGCFLDRQLLCGKALTTYQPDIPI